MLKDQASAKSQEKDEDIEQLKILIAALLQKKSRKDEDSKYQHSSEDLFQLKQENRELKMRIQSLVNENKQIIRQLLAERQENSRLKNQMNQSNTKQRVSFERYHGLLQNQKTISNIQPSRRLFESQLVRPQQSSPSRLVSFNQGTSNNRDQLYRLNSNLIQYNTNIKLLIEKYNYLHKLRGLNFPNDPEELKVIHQANQIFSNRKPIEQAHILLQSSRKKYFGSDSSSDIEEQLNQLEQGT